MALGDEFVVFDWFRILFVENRGMAYGIELGNKFFLTFFRIVAMLLAFYVLIKSIPIRKYSSTFLFFFTALIAGGVGNILDSIFYGPLFSSSDGQIAQFLPNDGGYTTWFMGHVVDMFYFPLITSTYPSWLPVIGGQEFTFFSPVFNFADSCISVGIVAILLFYPRTATQAIENAFEQLKKKVHGSRNSGQK